MENFLLSLIFGAIGAVLGSFSVAQVWRLRAKQLQEERELILLNGKNSALWFRSKQKMTARIA